MNTYKKGLKPVLLVSLPLLVMTGCASKQERQLASGGFKYTEISEGQSIKVPSDVDSPEFSSRYKLPKLGDDAPRGLLGKDLRISSPRLVLPVVTGSHVTEGTKTATVWFDKVDDSQPLDQTIWNSLIAFLDDRGIGVDTFDPEAQRLVTDWMIISNDEDESWYSWTRTEGETGRRFEFTLDLKPHGRSAALHTELVDYLKTTGNDVSADIDVISERQEEVDILNQVISYYDQQIQIANSNKLREIRQGLSTEMGFDPNGDPAFVVDAKYDITWPRTLLVLRKLGFDVKDLDKSNGLLFVTYSGAETSWWEDWFGSDNGLNLDEDDYRLLVKRQGEKTSITFMDDESQPFSAKQVADLYNAFSDVMSENDLDI
ncbi:outer membrane protein assembly factor BamC [Alteromonas oceanisediminis]|uniref:outer membrane protein assembly factor BamC n=1 Tax=Alteromonas oceanisediminis TaxID=2836180 RepID=UPI001BD9F0D7|nr:outer membrane protein assembly factor BamC [Alteromonas oceanisediminis]MBT0586363.1 outer membrane protein assembly factor BamC [Alteromonas oceanisediminis]